MIMYKNEMEQIVEKKLDEIYNTLDCCQCDKCRDDIVAYALNKLPTKYRVALKGEKPKTFILNPQLDAEIEDAIISGIMIVKTNPRHK